MSTQERIIILEALVIELSTKLNKLIILTSNSDYIKPMNDQKLRPTFQINTPFEPHADMMKLLREESKQ